MADNSTLPVAGGGTEVFANDDISSVKYPRTKVTWGPDGTANDTDVASGKPLPAQLRVSDGTAWTYGAGAVGTGSPRVTLASDDPLAAATKVDDAAFTPGTSRVVVMGAEADEAAPDSVDEGDAGALRMTLARGLHINIRDSAGAEVDLTAAVPVTIAAGADADAANFTAGEYETVAAGVTDQALGATGATGDYLEAVLIVPGTTAAGAVSIKDGSGSSISIFAGGGTTALADLAPIYVPLAIKSTGGAWKVTTGANVTAIGIGNFT